VSVHGLSADTQHRGNIGLYKPWTLLYCIDDALAQI
jgi:hypothetical protein